ncbi:MAG TPA: hypothetical protein GX708_08770 [Gallicola sp.]|nr:hypothetical protein [Gallicola sp.]
MVHLVYCEDKEKVLEKILEGTKKITATAIVKSVQNFVKLTEEQIDQVLHANQNELNLSKEQQKRWHKKCMCIVEFTDVKEIEQLDFAHQSNMDDWLIIEKIKDVLVGSSISYNYELSKFK